MNSKIKKLLGKNLKRFLSGFLAFAIMLTNITPVAYAFEGRLLMKYRLDHEKVMSEYNPNNHPAVGDGNTVYFALTDMDGTASRPNSHSFGDTDFSGVQGMIAYVNGNNEVVVSFNQDATPGHKFIQLEKDGVNYVYYFNLIGGTIGGMGGGHPSGIEIQWDYDFGMGANQFVVPDNSTKSVDLYVRNLPTYYTVDVLLGYVDTSVSDHPFVPYAETKGITLVRHSDDHITVNFDGKYLRDGNPGDYINGFFHVAAVIKNEDGVVVVSRGFDGYWESTHNGGSHGGMDIYWEHDFKMEPVVVEDTYARTIDLYANNVPAGHTVEVLIGYVDTTVADHPFVPYDKQAGVVAVNKGNGQYMVTFDGATLIREYPDDYAKGYFHTAAVIKDAAGNIVQSNGFDGYWTSTVNGGNSGGNQGGMDIFWQHDFQHQDVVVEDDYARTLGLTTDNVPANHTVEVLIGYVDTTVADHPFVPYDYQAGVFVRNDGNGQYTVTFDGATLIRVYPADYAKGFFHAAAVIKDAAGNIVQSNGFDGYWESTHNGGNGGAILPQFNGPIQYAILGSNGGQVWEEYVPGTILEISPYTMFGVRFMAGPGMQIANSDVTVSAQQGVASFSQHQNAESGQYTIVYMEGVPGQHDINFTICNQESAIIRVNAIDNSGGNQGDGIDMMVWDDFAQTYVGLSGLNLGQGYQDEIAFFDENGMIESRRITDIQLIPVGNMGTLPNIVKKGNQVIIHGQDESGNLASGEYIVKFKVDGIYKELELNIIPCEPPHNPTEELFSTTLPKVEHDSKITVKAVVGPPKKPTITPIEGYYKSMQESMLGVEFYESGKKVDVSNIECIGHSPDISVEMDSRKTTYGGIDIIVSRTARLGYHCAVFNVNGKIATVIVHANIDPNLKTDADINMKVWDDFRGEYVDLTALNLGQGYQDEIAFFDDKGMIDGQRITDILLVSTGNTGVTPYIVKDGNQIIIFGHDEDGRPASGEYIVKFKVDGVYKELELNIIPCEPPQNPENDFFSEELPQVEHDSKITVKAVVGPPQNPTSNFIVDYFASMQRSMLGVEFYDNGNKVDASKVEYIGGSSGLYVEMNSEYTTYGGIDIRVNDDARRGFHWAVFNVNGKTATVVIHANEYVDIGGGSGNDQPSGEDTFKGKTEIAPNVPAMQLPAGYSNWLDYDVVMAGAGGFQTISDKLFAIRFVDKNGKVIPSSRVELVSGHDTVMEFNLNADYKIVYFGNREFIGETYLTYMIDGQYYKTIKVVSQYAVIKDHQNENPTRVILENFRGSLNLDLDESYGDVVLELRGENIAHSHRSAAIKVANNLTIEGAGSLEIQFESEENNINAIEVGGHLNIHGWTDDNNETPYLKIKDTGRSKLGANILIGQNDCSINDYGVEVEGDITIFDSSEDYHCLYVNNSYIIANNIFVERSVQFENSILKTYLIQSHEDIHISRTYADIISYEEGVQVGIHADRNVMIMDSSVTVKGYPAYSDSLGFCTLIYAGEEISVEDAPEEDSGPVSFDALLLLETDAEQVYGMAAKNMSLHSGTIDITMDGYGSTAIYSFSNPDVDYGVALHKGNVSINSEGHGIWSNANIQLGNVDSGKINAGIYAQNGYALATDPVYGGVIILESEGIVLYGSEGAIQAKYVPVSTEEGWYDFGYNPDILLMTHENSLIDVYPITAYDDTVVGNRFIVTAMPDPSQLVTVKFDTDGADYKLLDMQKIIGNNYGQLPVPVKTGYIFLGWSLDKAGMLCVDYGFTVDKEIAKNGVITLYAQWEKGDANTTYLSSVWSKYFDLSEYEASGNYPVFAKGTTIYVDGYSEIDWPAPLVKSETKDIIFTGAGELMFRGEGSDAVINTSAKGTVKFTGKGMLNFYGGGIMSANCIEFNSGVVNIEVDEGYAIKTWRTKPEDIVVVVNKDAEVTAVSNTGIGLDAEGTSVLVEAGGTLRAAGAEYGIYTPANGYLCGNVTVESGGNLLAYGYKAAMRADSYNIKKASGKQMVAGYIPEITKAVKEYNNERYFAVGEEAYATNEEISTVWVNDYCFAPDEYFEGENFIYVPNTDYDGDKNVNVLYLGKGFKFEDPVDIEGAYAYIFSTEDIVVTSMGEGITQVATAEDVENIYSVYSFGDVRISNIKLGKADQDIHTENLRIDNEAEVTAGDVTVNGDLTANIASAYISGELYVDGDAILRGMNSEQVYDRYTLAFSGNKASVVKGNFILGGVKFTADGNLSVRGNVELDGGSTLMSTDGYSVLDVAGDITLWEYTKINGMSINASNVTNEGTINTNGLNIYGELSTGGSVNVVSKTRNNISKLIIHTGELTVQSEGDGIWTDDMNVYGGTVDIDARWFGIHVNADGNLNIRGGQTDIDAGYAAIFVAGGATAKINTPTNMHKATVRLHGEEQAVRIIGEFTPYGVLMTAADTYEGLNNAVTAYNGEKYFYVNGNTFHTVEFNANGGKFVTDTATEDTFTMNVPDNGVVDVHSIAVPSRANYVFTGWYLDETATQLYETDKAVTESMVLYAGWANANTVADVSITVDSADDTISIGDRIVLDTDTAGATIKYVISTSPIDTSLLDDSQLSVYKEAIQIKKSMISAESGDVIYIAAIAVKDEYSDSQWTVEQIDVSAGRDDWGDIAEEDRGIYTDALDVPAYLWVANVPEQLTYTGSALKPDDFRVYDGKKLLTVGVDYTVSYKNNTKVGQATITIKGKGNYADSLVEYFAIVPMSIEDENVFTTDVAGFMKTANGKEQKVSPKLLKDGKALKRNSDYTITYEKWNEETGMYETALPKETGNYNVVITGKGNYTGTVRMPYTITSNKLATTLKIKVVANKNELVYTGNPIEPAIEVKDGSKVLVNGVDYDVVYEDNINVGKALVSIIAKEGSGYEGGASVEFNITGVKLVSKMLKGTASILYADFMNIDKDDILPGMIMENAGYVMEAGTDYIVTYTYDKETDGTETEAGSVTMTVTGIGGFTGTLTKKFTIGTKLNAKMVKDFASSLTFVDNATDGLVLQPAELYNGDVVMAEGEDYAVRYTNNGKVGTATVEYIGRGEFYGTIKKTFKITAIKLDGKKVTVDGLESAFDYVAGGVQQTGYTFWYDGTPLVEGTDYTVSYKNNIKAGKATITFTGMGGYSGSWKYDYKINAVDASQLNIDCNEVAEYTKSATLVEPVITYGDTVLVKGTDYTLKYSGNTKLTTDTSKAKVIVTFKGNYAGKAEFSYDIVKSSLSNVNISVADVVFKNKANQFKAVPKLTDTNGKVLAAKTDYANTLVYTYAEDTTLANGAVRLAGDIVAAKDIVPAGTYIMVTVTGAGNYEGEVSAIYRIISGSVASASVTIEAQNYTGNPVQLAKNQITVKVGGVELADDEYEIIGYTNNTGKGTAKVTIQGVGNYGGVKTVNFSIQAKSAKTTIKFMANGGSGSVAAVTVMNKDVMLTSIFNAKGKQTLTRKGYTFVGWNTEKDGSGIAYSDADIFLAQDREGMRTIRLYAQWEAI